MAAPSPKGLVVEGLSKTYTSAGGKVEALKGVSFSVSPGKVLGVLGPSGCGKTTLLRSIAGLEEPDEGTILLGERALWAPRRGIRLPPERREVGMVFQSYAIWPHMTVFENVAFPLRVRRRPEAEVRQRVGSVLEMVRLFGLENRPATDLSGGQQQRVAWPGPWWPSPAFSCSTNPFLTWTRSSGRPPSWNSAPSCRSWGSPPSMSPTTGPKPWPWRTRFW